METLQAVGKNPRLTFAILGGNLVLRLLLVAFAASTGRTLMGDSSYYLDVASRVCNGEWGGDPYRMPLYSWFLCGTSFTGIGLALTIQTVLVWAIGALLARRGRLGLAVLWLFDPVLLIYSGLVMTDAFFAVSLFLTSLGIRRVLLEKQVPTGIIVATAAGMAVSILTRPIGIPLLLFTGALCGVQLLRRQIRWKPVVVFFSLTIALLVPRVYWNGTHHGLWKLTSQGANITQAMAGIVEFTDQGYDFTASELKWKAIHPNATAQDAYRSLMTHFQKFAYLTAKGVARVLVGHVNVEWGYLFTGTHPIGPGWFKTVDEGAPEQRVTSIWIWSFGVIATALFTLAGFAYLALLLIRARTIDAFIIWALGTSAMLALAPLVVGDARFRAPVLAVLVALAFVSGISDSRPGTAGQRR